MALQPENNDDESFIILGTSPGTSLDIKCNGLDNGMSLDRLQLDDALKDLPNEASMAFKAHFKLGDCPSPASMMVASTIITDDKSTEEIQKQFGELLDENVILKETLKQNNESLKEQFLLIASCQEDMMKTHMMHKEKFDETRVLVDKLRQENKKLKTDLTKQSEPDSLSQPMSTSQETTSGPSSALEFVTSPDDDTINKLTAQLELVEKQRRQVIVDNEKLTWQKESLEHIIDATSKERDELKEKVKKLELQMSSVSNEYTHKISILNSTIQDLDTKFLSATCTSISPEELSRRDSVINQLEAKVLALQHDLKAAQLKVFDLENVKLDFSKHKAGVCDTVKIYREQIMELSGRLKEAQTTVFQPVRFSISSELDSSNSEYATLMANVKLYDKTLKHLADLLNVFTHGAADTFVHSQGLLASLQDFKLDRTTADQFKSSLAEVKNQLEKQHATALNNIAQVRGTLSVFEGIFKDYNELLKKVITKQDCKAVPAAANVEALTNALLARGQEIQSLQSDITLLTQDKEDRQLLKAQLDLYKSDFDAEREAREKMASEKETIATDLRTAQRKNQELLMQLEQVRKLNPNIYKSATTKRMPPQTKAATTTRRPPAAVEASTTTGNLVYTCPKCLRFSASDYSIMDMHFDYCLEDI